MSPERLLPLLLLLLLAPLPAQAASVHLPLSDDASSQSDPAAAFQRAMLRLDLPHMALLAPALVVQGRIGPGVLDVAPLDALRPEAWAIARAAVLIRDDRPGDALPLLRDAATNEHVRPLWCEVAGRLPGDDLRPWRRFLCEETLEVHPDLPPDLLAELAERAFRTLHRSDALPILRQVDALLPPDGRHACVLRPAIALTLERLRERDEAFALFTSMVDACEPYPEAHVRALYALALRNANRGDTEAAVTWAEALLERYPERTHADDILALLARLQPERAEALAWRGIEEHPDGDLVGELILVAARTMEPDDARAFLRRVSDGPWRDPAYQTAGRVEFELARLSEDPCPALERLAERYPWTFSADIAERRWGSDACPGLFPPSPVAPGRTLRVEIADRSLATTLQRLIDLQAWEVAIDVLAARSLDAPDAHWLLAGLHLRSGDPHRAHAATRWGTLYGWQRDTPRSDARWLIAYPEPWSREVAAAAAATGVPSSLIRAVMREESAFQPSVESFAGALGLMQVMPTTAEEARNGIEGPLNRERLLDPATNIRIGANYLAFLLERHPNDIARVAAAYNAGPGRVRQWMGRLPADDEMDWIEAIPFTEAIHYTRRVMETERIYRFRPRVR